MQSVRILICVFLAACGNQQLPTVSAQEASLDSGAQNLETRFVPPIGAKRVALAPNAFGAYLRSFPLKPIGADVHLYNGTLKYRQDVHAAVLDIDVGERDLQQCADAVMRLRAEFLYQQKRYTEIHFNFTNGFRAEYSRWRAGERIRVSGNQVQWVPGGTNSSSYTSFRQYLNTVFAYAGTASYEKELKAVEPRYMMPGDVFIHGGHPGHAVVVMDVAEDVTAGKRYFLLAQSYMPAQEIHVLKNFSDTGLSPWFEVDLSKNTLETPEWGFDWSELKRI